MPFKGLFIGVDHYASTAINHLTMAKRDAWAMQALFTDTLGEGATLLVDKTATRTAILEELEKLTACHEDDLVVFYFSGHGSETGELVTYDTFVSNLRATSIPLDDLEHYIARIPSKQIVCILDCCFSGVLGSKFLRVEAKPRGLISNSTLIEQLAGEGRVILTASRADQSAYEHPRLGHGLLTFSLLEALQGAEEVLESGRIKLYPLLEYVIRRVVDKAAELHLLQEPTFRGIVDGEFTLPVFKIGEAFHSLFPESVPQPVTDRIDSLSTYGLPPELLAVWAKAIPSLNELQVAAINDFRVLRGEHLVVSAPTSSGKTMIGELAALKAAVQGQRSFFLLPLKALVNDKHGYFNSVYGSLGITTIRATGEISDDIPALMRGQYDICLMTYEKFSALALGAPHIIRQVSTVVVDEVQMISDESRGVNLEFLLTLLRVLRNQAVEPQIIALSAVIGDTNGLERWLGARLLRRETRPVPLREGMIRADGTYHFLEPDGQERTESHYVVPEFRKGSSQDVIIPLVRKLVEEDKQVIVFRETRGEARGTAGYLANTLGLPPAQTALDALPVGDLSDASDRLREVLRGGVAFHISDLDREERRVVEEEFRKPDSQIRVIAATTTLAMGVNTPASAVVISGLEHPGPITKAYTIAEYKNMVGRAGRLGYTERGESFLVLIGINEPYAWNHYILGKPENISSHFLTSETDLRSILLRVLATAPSVTNGGLSSDNVAAFLEGSFAAYQQAQSTPDWKWSRPHIEDALRSLQQHQLVEVGSDNTLRLTQLGRFAGASGVEVESIVRLVDILRSVSPETVSDPLLLAATQVTVELDDVNFPLNKKSTIKEPAMWFGELQRQGVPAHVLQSIQRDVKPERSVARAKRAVACLLWVMGMPLADMERVLTQFGSPSRAVAGDIRSVASRTADLLPSVAQVAQFVHVELDLTNRVEKLLIRLELGIDATSVELAGLLKTQLNRSDYKRLDSAGLNSVEALRQAPDELVLSCVGASKERLNVIRTLLERKQMPSPIDTEVPTLPMYRG